VPPEFAVSSNQEAIIRRYPVVTYFALTFLISWTSALAGGCAEPHPPPTSAADDRHSDVSGHASRSKSCWHCVDEDRRRKSGLRVLLSQMFRAWVPPRWYTALLLPPALVLTVLLFLERFVSPVYAPYRFFMGILFGIPAGFLEEIGWMGYAFPKMRSESNGLAPSILLGLLWALWHLPVINYLGTATPHGAYWLPFFLAFSLAMTAMRVLIAWIYTNTKSVLLAQLMHVSSTGSLVLFSAARVTAAQEAMWYALYGTVLWIAVGVVVKAFGRCLGRHAV